MKKTAFAAIAACFALPAMACELDIRDPYARAASSMAQSGAAFMELANIGTTDCHVTGAASTISARTELHTHVEDANGVMRMVEIAEGFHIPAGESVMLERGGKHVMFLGLNQTLAQGDDIGVTLLLADGSSVDLVVPVDNERADMPAHGHGHGHGGAHRH